MADQNTPLPHVNVDDIMNKKVHRVRLEMTVHKAIGILLENKISGAPVVDHMNKVITVVSQTDLMKIAAKMGLKFSIANCLDMLPKHIVSIHKTANFTELYRMFLAYPVHRIIVTDNDGRLQGLVSRSNVLKLLYGEGSKQEENLPDTNLLSNEVRPRKKKAS